MITLFLTCIFLRHNIVAAWSWSPSPVSGSLYRRTSCCKVFSVASSDSDTSPFSAAGVAADADGPPRSESETDEEARRLLSADLIRTARGIGQVGSRASESDREALHDLARQLEPLSDPEPARIGLSGVHDLVYSASPGGSSGAIGPFTGEVSQEFVDDVVFQNVVRLGPLEVRLVAERKVLDDRRIRVVFKETIVKVLGIEVARKEAKGAGVWKQVFVGEVELEGKRKLLRVMETPSLFVIVQDAGSPDRVNVAL